MSSVVVRGLEAGYRGVPAVRDVTLSVDAGEVVTLLGANGAGKTTTLMTIAGVLPALAGEVEVLSAGVPRRRPHIVARRGLALVPEDRGLFPSLTTAENLRLGRRNARRKTIDAVDYFPALGPLMNRKCGLLSGGEQQMLAIAKALVSDPKALLIDELSLGLAPVIVEHLLPVVRSIARDREVAVLLVEQHVELALKVADRGYILARGEVAFEGPAAALLERRDLLEVHYLGGGEAPR